MKGKRWFVLIIFIEGLLILQSRILNKAFLSKVTNTEDDHRDDILKLENANDDPKASQLENNMDFINSFLSSMPMLDQSNPSLNPENSNPQHKGDEIESSYFEVNSKTHDRERQSKVFVEDFKRGSNHNSVTNSESVTLARNPTDLFLEAFLKKAVSEPSSQDTTNAQKYVHDDVPHESHQKSGFNPQNIWKSGESHFLNSTDRRLINDKDLFEYYEFNEENSELDVAQDRQLFIPFNPIDTVFVEAKYENLVLQLPRLIDTARADIIKEIATLNMLGYSIAAGFAVGVVCDTIGSQVNILPNTCREGRVGKSMSWGKF